MINPTNSNHLARLSRSADHAVSQLDKFHRMRADTIHAYTGLSPFEPDYAWDRLDDTSSDYRRGLPKGNLLQLDAIATQLGMAYGEPQFLAQAQQPEHYGTADSLEPALNRMSLLLNLGDTARKVAADSFFGYGIFKVGVGRLPAAARAFTGLTYGPCIWRVSQPNFVYDVTSQGQVEKCGFMGDIYTMPLDDAIEMYPNAADRLVELTDSDWNDRFSTSNQHSRSYTPEPMVVLYDGYLPGTRVVATWVIRGRQMRSLADQPIGIRDYNGHWSGVYEVLNHLYQPDDMLPIAQAESVKAVSYLFNDILSLTSEQARNAKYNPTFVKGGEKDAAALWGARDRVPVGVEGSSEFGVFEIPGPTQSQTNYLSAIMGLFKQMTFNLDARLGLGNLGGTATESRLINEQANAMTAEMRRKFLRSLQLVGYKLGHLLMESQDIVLPLRRPLMPGSDITVDVSWKTPQEQPRVAKIDDFDVHVESYSLRMREPEQRLAQISQIEQQIILPAMAAEAQGFPIDSREVLKTAAKYSGNPELLDWHNPVDPVRQQLKRDSSMTAKRADVGRYVRENVTEQTSDGDMAQALNNTPDENRSENVG
jgi:hypothetical protein